MRSFRLGIIIFLVCIIICVGILVKQESENSNLTAMRNESIATADDVLTCFLFSSVDTYLTSYYTNNYDLSILIQSEDLVIQEITKALPYYEVTVMIHPHFIDESNTSYDKIEYQITTDGELIHKNHQHISDKKS